MLRTVFMIGLFAILGLFLLKVFFGVFGVFFAKELNVCANCVGIEVTREIVAHVCARVVEKLVVNERDGSRRPLDIEDDAANSFHGNRRAHDVIVCSSGRCESPKQTGR